MGAELIKRKKSKQIIPLVAGLLELWYHMKVHDWPTC